MIGHLRGTLASKFPGELIIDVGGIGYQVIVSLSTFYGLPAVGAEVSLDIHTHVREDSLQLYGFCDRHENGRYQECRLDHRPGARGGRTRRRDHRHGHAREANDAGALIDRRLPEAAAERE